MTAKGLAPLLLCLATLPVLAGPPVEGQVLPYRQVDLSARVPSFIVEMKVKEGDPVKAGQVLLQLYDKLEELEMKRAKAQLDRREYEARGAKSLYDNKIIPEAKSRESRLELDLARLNFETATEQFRLRTLESPIDGVVAERFREQGEAVSPGQPVFTIVDLSKVYIVFAVRAEKLGQLALGQKLTVRFPQLENEAPQAAEVVLLAPRADAHGGFKVKLLLGNPDFQIKGGFKALVDLPDSH